MKLLTLYTQAYEPVLRSFFTDAGDISFILRGEGRRDGLFFTRCAYDRPDSKSTEALACLLEQIAIQENPVYRYSKKLTQLALELRNTPVHTAHVSHLAQYLRENRRLHLEGYALFRMSEYRSQLDRMMFSLIKRLKLPER